MRQMQTLAFFSCELHRKEIVPDVPIAPIVQSLHYVHHGDGSFADVQNVPVVPSLTAVQSSNLAAVQSSMFKSSK
jgi:hypothetical protein